MTRFKAFLKRKDIVFSARRYGIDAFSAMAQGLFCTLLVGTILNTLGAQLHIGFLTAPVATVGGTDYTIGSIASAMVGPAMAVAIFPAPQKRMSMVSFWLGADFRAPSCPADCGRIFRGFRRVAFRRCRVRRYTTVLRRTLRRR